MTVIKQYNTDTDVWETIVVGEQGPPGLQGETGSAGPQGEPGIPGPVVAIRGTIFGVDTAFPVFPATGDMWLVGDPIPTIIPDSTIGPPEIGDGVVWDGVTWNNVGPVRGPEGPAGIPGGGGITSEQAIDAVAVALTEGAGIDLAYDDGAGTITVTVDKTEIALGNVDNTADTAKPVSTAQQAAIDAHAADTTAIHGITDTSALVTTALTASTTVVGIVELATAAEVLTGTDTTRAVTAAGATGAFASRYPTLNAQTGTTYTLVLADDGKLVTLSNAAAIALTVPTNASVAFPIGTRIDIAQIGAGQVTVSGAGTTLNATPGLKLRAQYAAVTLVKTATDTWLIVGDLSA